MKQKVILGCIVLILGVIAVLMLRPSTTKKLIAEEADLTSVEELMDEFLENHGWEIGCNTGTKGGEWLISHGVGVITLPSSHPYYEGARFLAYKGAVAESRSGLAKFLITSIGTSEEGGVEDSKQVAMDSRFGEMSCFIDSDEGKESVLMEETPRTDEGGEIVLMEETPRMVAEPYVTFLFETENEVGVIGIWSQSARDSIVSGRSVTITFKNVRTKENRAVIESVVAKINDGSLCGGVVASDAELVDETKIKCTLRGMNRSFLAILQSEIPNFPFAITVGESNILATF